MSEAELTTRDRILRAAKEEFLEKGYKDAWLRDISKKAGVTTGALYGYFKSKKALFGALVDDEYHHLLNMYDEILAEFRQLPAERQVTDMKIYTEKGMERMSEYIYDHLGSFKLILCCSEETQYCHLVEEMAERDIQATDDFSQTSQSAGIVLDPVNPILKRMLICSMFSNYFEMVRQNLPREEIDQYIHQLLKFYIGGWEKMWGNQ